MLNGLLAKTIPLMPEKLVWVFSKKYIAGKSINSAIEVTKELTKQDYRVTVDLLGEFIKTMDQADANKKEYFKIIEEFEKQKLGNTYSLKPSMFGLLINEEECYQNMRDVVAKSADYDTYVRIDMEDSPCTDKEIDIYNKLRGEYPKKVGLVLQAYLKRTINDIEELLKTHSDENPINFRICKGIYVEPEEIAYKKYQEINDNFLKIVELLFKNNIYVGLATHDKYLVDGLYNLIEKYNVPKDRYEFQMLYGVTPGLRNSIHKKEHPLRVYVPFGEEWFKYSTRRLKENPNMISHIMKSIFVRG